MLRDCFRDFISQEFRDSTKKKKPRTIPAGNAGEISRRTYQGILTGLLNEFLLKSLKVIIQEHLAEFLVVEFLK